MANKAISELPQAQNVNNQDLFVLEQGGLAKKLTAETFITEQGIIDALAEALDGHGGIQSVTLSSVSGRIRTYLITFTDGSATTFQVLDGNTIDRIAKTSTAGLVDTYTVFMSDGTTTFFTVTNGADGTVSEAMLNDALKDKAPAVTETTESSAIANFTDGADDMPLHNILAEINPVQDLNGYDNPWPAGGGKNLLDPDERTNNTQNIYFYQANGFLLKENQTYTFSVYSSENAAGLYIHKLSDNSNLAVKYNSKTVTYTPTEDVLAWFDAYYSPSPTGGTANINVQLELGSTATAWTPYSNVCPITGWTGCNVTRAGKNLYDFGNIQITANVQENIDFSEFMNLKAGTYTLSYTLDKTVTATRNRPAYYSTSGSYVYAPSDIKTAGRGSWTFTLASDTTLDFFWWSHTVSEACTISGIQLEVGTTATTYEPYITASTVSFSWQTEAGTVYGGTIDVATGLLTVDRGFVTYDGSDDESWSLQSVNSYNIANFSISHTHYSGTANYLALCNYLTAQTSAIAATQTNGFLVHQNGSTIYIRLSTSYASTVTELRTWLANNPLQIVYGLTTPQTYQLTPQQLMTLLGTNNVWADTGNVSVTYPADTKMFIEKLTMPTEDDLVANQAITSGKYFMVGNSLYLALANIASGGQITIGTNAQRVSLADALNTINS